MRFVRDELTKVFGQLPASVSTHHSFVLHVALVSDQQHLGVVPRVRFDLSRPGNQHTQLLERKLQACVHPAYNVLGSLIYFHHTFSKQQKLHGVFLSNFLLTFTENIRTKPKSFAREIRGTEIECACSNFKSISRLVLIT